MKRIDQNGGLPVLPCACASLRRASRVVTQAYNREFRRVGLNTAQFTLLYVMNQAGEMTQGRLGRLLALDITTLSRTLRPLEGKGWLECTRGGDWRERYWRITSAGKKVLEKATPAWERAQKALSARLGGKSLNAMVEELAVVAGASRARSTASRARSSARI
jgi:DNA-binding MarR family transcriptional regulator